MEALLTPIPSIHLEDTPEIFEKNGRVAYGSDAVDVFYGLRAEGLIPGFPVLIYASSADSAHLSHLLDIGRIVALAKLDRIEEGRAGKHKRPELRTKRAHEQDTGFSLFWEIIDLHWLKPSIALTAARKRTSNGKAGAPMMNRPRRPLRILTTEPQIISHF